MADQPGVAHVQLPWAGTFNAAKGEIAFYGLRADGIGRATDGLGRLFSVDLASRETREAGAFPDVDPQMWATAAFIGRACDVHERLLAALKSAVAVIDGQQEASAFDLASARAVIRAAEAPFEAR